MASVESLVIRANGIFNHRIINPSWLIDHLSVGLKPLKPKDVELAYDVNDNLMTYKINDIQIVPTERNILIIITKKDDNHIVYGTRIFLKILKLLPYTPINAIGFNIIYKLGSVDKLGYLNPLITNPEKVPKMKTVVYEKPSGSEYICNIVCRLHSTEDYVIEYNYHYQTNFDQLTKDTLINHFEESKKEIL